MFDDSVADPVVYDRWDLMGPHGAPLADLADLGVSEDEHQDLSS